MSVSTTQRTRWTTSDIALLPDNGTRYEIIARATFKLMRRTEHDASIF